VRCTILLRAGYQFRKFSSICFVFSAPPPKSSRIVQYGGSAMKFKKLKKMLKKFRIEWDPKAGKGSHGSFVGRSHKTKIRESHTIPSKQQVEISSIYVNSLRRTFELTESDGVSDEEFFGTKRVTPSEDHNSTHNRRTGEGHTESQR